MIIYRSPQNFIGAFFHFFFHLICCDFRWFLFLKLSPEEGIYEVFLKNYLPEMFPSDGSGVIAHFNQV